MLQKKKKGRFVTRWNLKDRFEYNVSTAKSWKYTTITFKRGNLDPRAQISSASVGSSACQHVVTAHRSLRSVGHTSKLAARVGPDNTLLGRATSEVKRQRCPPASRGLISAFTFSNGWFGDHPSSMIYISLFTIIPLSPKLYHTKALPFFDSCCIFWTQFTRLNYSTYNTHCGFAFVIKEGIKVKKKNQLWLIKY